MYRPALLALTVVAVIAAAVGFACADLPLVEPDTCGNRILEPELGEDCDGSALGYGPDATCGAPNSAAPCRLTCTPQVAVSGCPPGWGCGTDGVCRRPTAELELGSLPGEARAVGDLDGDGRDDIVMRGPTGEAEVAFFTEGRNIAELFVDPARREISDEPGIQPFIGALTNDGVDDLALPLVGDDIVVRVFMGSESRTLSNPFVELVTVPFAAAGDVTMETAFNPVGRPQALCEIGGCTDTLLLGKAKAAETRYAVLDDRELIELFRLDEGRRQSTTGLARWDQSLPCDVLAISYHGGDEGPASDIVELFGLCKPGGGLNRSEQDPIGTVPALSSVRVSETEPGDSLVISGYGDVNGDGWPDMLLNVTDEDPSTIDDAGTYALYGTGDGHFNARADFSALEPDLADRNSPLIFPHSWATGINPEILIEHAVWPQAMADINADGRADFLLTAGLVALSTQDPEDACTLAGESTLRGPPLGEDDQSEWGYACLLVTQDGLIDAATASTFDMGQDSSRNWKRSGSLATSIDLQGQGRPGFAAIDKNKVEYAGQLTDHTPTDYLDLLWVDPSSSQLILQTIEGERFEQVAAGDIDGDFAVDLVIDFGDELETIWGPPFDIARATPLSPTGFDVMRTFSEGLPSASLAAERDGRLTILRDGQWPALALIEPGECAMPESCHVRFATGTLGDELDFGWALAVVQSSVGGGLRLLRALEGQADLGPAYDSTAAELVPLSALDLSTMANRVTVIALELDDDDSDTAIDEAVVIARTDEGVEVATLRAALSTEPEGDFCGPIFFAGPGAEDQRVVCFEHVNTLYIPSEARTHALAEDPFIEIADANGDGFTDISWVTVNNHVMLLLNDGSGVLSLDGLLDLAIPEPEDGDEPEGEPEPDDPPQTPTRIDWIRWTELDGTIGRELVSSDVLGSGLLWGINVHFEEAELDPRGSLLIETSDPRNMGFRGDFDGDGVDDIALGRLVMFGKPVND